MGHSLGKTKSKFYEVSRKAHSEWMKENAPCKNPEIAKRHSEWMTGENNPAKRPELRKVVSDRFKGVKKTDEHRAKIAKAYEDPEKRKAQLAQIHCKEKCLECGYVTNRGNMTKHQRKTGHSGTERV